LNLASFLLKDKAGQLTIDRVQQMNASFLPITQEMYNFNQDKDVRVCTCDEFYDPLQLLTTVDVPVNNT